MNGTTLCPHCDTRFKIVEAQLEVHHGMVRCGHCLQAFDARPTFVPDQPSPQLELPILDEPDATSGLHIDEDQAAPDASELTSMGGAMPDAYHSEGIAESSLAQLDTAPDNVNFKESDEAFAEVVATQVETPVELAEPSHHDALDSSPETPAESVAASSDYESLKPAKTLAEQVAIIEDEHDSTLPASTSKWPWTLAALLCLFILAGQAAYFFRVDLAARLPGLKPALVGYCQILKCSVSLPQKSELMSIESSDLEADPAQETRITLNALLRNRATFSQAFPHLELTLNDTQDKPLARRVFKPADYLPPIESENFGLLPNHELGIKLHLDVTDIKPTGYRLVLFYPNP